jgi:hypothetical protein
VSQYKAVFDAPPTRVPSRDSVGGPLLGNGDLGAVISGAPEAQRFWISKKVETLKGERVMLKTEAGVTVVLVPEGKECPADA